MTLVFGACEVGGSRSLSPGQLEDEDNRNRRGDGVHNVRCHDEAIATHNLVQSRRGACRSVNPLEVCDQEAFTSRTVRWASVRDPDMPTSRII